MEIERKFFVKELSSNLMQFPFKNLTQGYLSFDPEIRIRSMNDIEFYLTQKGKGDLSRPEEEIPIAEKTFTILSNLISGRVIEKRRYYISLGIDMTAELDIYSGELDGLSTIEIEFETEEQAMNFSIPDWFGEEVTFNKRYKNKNLARCSYEDLKLLVKESNSKKLIKKDK